MDAAETTIPGLTPLEHATAAELFVELFGQLRAIGRGDDGSSTRLAWTRDVAEAEAWFDATAARLGLTLEVDRNGNRWAWSAPEPDAGAVVTGSHLDTVPSGGSFDGALGVVSGLIAASIVLDRGREGAPLGVVAFADEEGGRFNTPTFGSRLLTGKLDLATVTDRVDAGGVTLSEALRSAGRDLEQMGRDEKILRRLEAFVELHIEQGLLLAGHDQPIGLATTIIPHGRWRMELRGQANHGGTTAIFNRRDPMIVLAELLRAGREVAEREDSLVTVGKLEVWPNAPTSIAEQVTAWIDVRSEDERTMDAIVAKVGEMVGASAARHGVEVEVEAESRTPEVRFSPALAERIRGALAQAHIEPVPMSTGAGHDAGVLSAVLPAAMLFVRNETGISHSRAEDAQIEDCLAGIGALATVLDDLRNRRPEGSHI